MFPCPKSNSLQSEPHCRLFSLVSSLLAEPLPSPLFRQQYEYLSNFKVLQNTFKAHSIDKVRLHSYQVRRTSERATSLLRASSLEELRPRFPLAAHQAYDPPSSSTLTPYPALPPARAAHPRGPPRQLQDARQPRIPAVAEEVLGPQLSGWRV